MRQELERELIDSRRFFAEHRGVVRPFLRFLALSLVVLAPRYTYPVDGYGRLQEYGLESCWSAEASQDSMAQGQAGALPGGEEARWLGAGPTDPGLGGGESGETLMRTNVVVPDAKHVVDSLLHRSEEALDSFVLPGAEGVAQQVANAESPERSGQDWRGQVQVRSCAMVEDAEDRPIGF